MIAVLALFFITSMVAPVKKPESVSFDLVLAKDCFLNNMKKYSIIMTMHIEKAAELHSIYTGPSVLDPESRDAALAEIVKEQVKTSEKLQVMYGGVIQSLNNYINTCLRLTVTPVAGGAFSRAESLEYSKLFNRLSQCNIENRELSKILLEHFEHSTSLPAEGTTIGRYVCFTKAPERSYCADISDIMDIKIGIKTLITFMITRDIYSIIECMNLSILNVEYMKTKLPESFMKEFSPYIDFLISTIKIAPELSFENLHQCFVQVLDDGKTVFSSNIDSFYETLNKIISDGMNGVNIVTTTHPLTVDASSTSDSSSVSNMIPNNDVSDDNSTATINKYICTNQYLGMQSTKSVSDENALGFSMIESIVYDHVGFHISDVLRWFQLHLFHINLVFFAINFYYYYSYESVAAIEKNDK